MNYLALDIGRRHTGVAFADAKVRVALPLDSIHHDNDEEFVSTVTELINDRNINIIAAGFPLMNQGEEGEEVEHVRDVLEMITEKNPHCEIRLIDERETSKIYHPLTSKDRHAQAATSILQVTLSKEEN